MISIGQAPAKPDLMKELERLGKVSSPDAQDFEMRHGVSVAFQEKKALIIDVIKVSLKNASTAEAQVSIYSSALDATICVVEAHSSKGQWSVGPKDPRCTL